MQKTAVDAETAALNVTVVIACVGTDDHFLTALEQQVRCSPSSWDSPGCPAAVATAKPADPAARTGYTAASQVLATSVLPARLRTAAVRRGGRGPTSR